MKEQWKFDKYAKVLSKLEGEGSAPVQIDLPSVAYVRTKDDCGNKVLILLRILILTACLSFLSWGSIWLYSDNEIPSISKYILQDETLLSQILIDDLKNYQDWAQKSDDSFMTTPMVKPRQQTNFNESNYETSDNDGMSYEIESKNIYMQNFTGILDLAVSLLDNQRTKLNLAVIGIISLMKSLSMLEKYDPDLTRDEWKCKLLENETEKTRIDMLEFIEVSQPHLLSYEKATNCTEISDDRKNSTSENTSDSFEIISVIVDPAVNLLFTKYVEFRVGDFFKLLLWYVNNRDSEYFKHSENDVKVLAAKILFSTDLVKYRETLDQLRTIIEQDKSYENDYEKLLNGTLHNFVVNTNFQIIMMSRLSVKTAAERLYAYGIINAETLNYIIPIVNEVAKDYYVSRFDVRNTKDTNETSSSTI